MNTCSNCALWGEADTRSTTHRACISAKISDSDMYDERNTLVYPYSEGGVFRAGPDFGCVHHIAIAKTLDIDLNEDEHPWGHNYVGFYTPPSGRDDVTHVASVSGEFTARELRYIAEFMDGGKAVYQPNPD